MNTTLNSTLPYHHSKAFAISELAPTTYDSTGAILFIIVVLFWYSMGIVCMLGMQIKVSDETVEDCAKRRAKLLIETLRDQTHTKQILEELVDKEKRDKLWDIYLGTTDNNNDKLIRAEILRIRNIEKQLAIINQNRIIMNESLITSTTIDSQSTIISDLSSIENRARVRRRSSLDQQIIERWKSLVGQCKTHEQLPWPIQKLMIRRHFRRHYKGLLRESEPINTSIHEQYRLIPNRQMNFNNSRRVIESNIQDYPLDIVKPDYQVIQIDNVE